MLNLNKVKSLCRQSLLVAMLLPLAANASNMSLNKHRILLDGKNNRDDLLVFNPSADFQSYRISVADFAMDEHGQLRRAAEFDASAKAFIRVGPRLGRNIAPNNSQSFRVMLKGRNLADGEYRSHIVIEALQPPQPKDSDGIHARPNIKYSIPVIVRKGQLQATVDITNAKITEDESEQNKLYLQMSFARSGNRSVFGNIRVYEKSQPEQLLLNANSIGIYPELKQRQVRLPLQNKLPNSGVLVIEFAENPEYGGDLTASYQLPLSQS